ncbi:VOC family protein [Paractinoplanes lichenicola]|uniref:VOC family protein n=1 Tax=Paractinoplanes lichenicola TaxID=2802976 RepID=A0ABS1VL44_9ACTN|nr:VOC family protein [Actinoplanes lichenicola]MBL7255431.1 VOC family protein [Actinoplanes lichenicola]
MTHPVVHFEIIGTDPAALRGYYGSLFGWSFDTSGPVAASVSEPGSYGFTPAGDTIPGGVGGGAGFRPQTVFYVGVPDVEEALRRAEALGGRRVMGPERPEGRDLVVAHFTDPEGNLIGLAGPA